ncbi:hypothetical protein QJS04_geneDACA001336 [Acorus gramineus]|uniref:Uncharacterized protein n=1 Tax=Acorus gramineus TaxID=55184 RepID=A0AAV9AE95_ACOGR|nr:hypothetical protein QJS04_geneDACA001336 [Acorus gramineus]
MARKWWRAAASRRRRTPSSIIIAYRGSDEYSEALVTATTTNKGHFVVYTSDGSRFVVPLAYLKSDIIRELLEMSANEFGFPGDGPLFKIQNNWRRHIYIWRIQCKKKKWSTLTSASFYKYSPSGAIFDKISLNDAIFANCPSITKFICRQK